MASGGGETHQRNGGVSISSGVMKAASKKK